MIDEDKTERLVQLRGVRTDLEQVLEVSEVATVGSYAYDFHLALSDLYHAAEGVIEALESEVGLFSALFGLKARGLVKENVGDVIRTANANAFAPAATKVAEMIDNGYYEYMSVNSEMNWTSQHTHLVHKASKNLGLMMSEHAEILALGELVEYEPFSIDHMEVLVDALELLGWLEFGGFAEERDVVLEMTRVDVMQKVFASGIIRKKIQGLWFKGEGQRLFNSKGTQGLVRTFVRVSPPLVDQFLADLDALAFKTETTIAEMLDLLVWNPPSASRIFVLKTEPVKSQYPSKCPPQITHPAEYSDALRTLLRR